MNEQREGEFVRSSQRRINKMHDIEGTKCIFVNEIQIIDGKCSLMAKRKGGNSGEQKQIIEKKSNYVIRLLERWGEKRFYCPSPMVSAPAQ